MQDDFFWSKMNIKQPHGEFYSDEYQTNLDRFTTQRSCIGIHAGSRSALAQSGRFNMPLLNPYWLCPPGYLVGTVMDWKAAQFLLRPQGPVTICHGSFHLRL
jgi:hypothetical protein